MSENPPAWFAIRNLAEVPSPSLLVYPDRVEENVRRMIAATGDVRRLRPHMKTHKMPALIRMQLAQGITKFKCATIAEAEMTASCGAPDVLLAYQPVGPNAVRMVQLARQYPDTRFSAVVDDEAAIRRLSEIFSAQGLTLTLLLDMDCGMHRCGIEPGPHALELYQLIIGLAGLNAGGLHAYDGHLHGSDPVARAAACDAAFAPIFAFRNQLKQAGLSVPTVVAGGTPTFPMHARRTEVECSPGTCVFWDFGYADTLGDMDFLVAALVLTRVVSQPGGNRLCLDLGHKSIAAENPHPRVRLIGLEDATFVTHSEEHLVIQTPRAGEFKVGDALFGIPRHICPTVALHAEAVVVRERRSVDRWKVAARERRLTI
jgi:D-serine deaminase-like pyridoxal phosphate-dependent protein